MTFKDQAMSISNSIGSKIPEVTQKILEWITSQGFVTGIWTARLISIAIFLAIAYAVVTLAQNMKPLLKYAIVIVLILIAVSIGAVPFTGG